MIRRVESAYKLHNWSEISNNFQNADLLLGNGFSVSLNKEFSADSLFKSFYDKLNEEEKYTVETLMYVYVGSTCFEKNLRFLDDPYRFIQDDEVLFFSYEQGQEIVQKIRNDILTIIIDSLENFSSNGKMEKYLNSLKTFQQIYTLNFDLLLYYITMFYNINSSKNEQFCDCFSFSEIRPNELLKFVGLDGSYKKFIYYLHGSIMFFSNECETYKVKGDRDTKQLTRIKEYLNLGKKPLVVLEGSSDEKIRKIKKSNYLNFCYNKLRNSQNKLVIFGASLDSVDNHIVEAINNNKKEIAISIYLENSFFYETIYEQYIEKFKISGSKISFFDSKTFFE